MRIRRMLALGASTLALAGACSTGGGGTSTPSAAALTPSTVPSVASAGPVSAAPASAAPASAAASTAASTIAGQLVLGGPPECPQRPFCLVGLEKTYGLSFKSFVPLDAGGPLTVAALATNKIQVGLLFTSDPSIAVKGFVLLNDDRHLQASDNIAPVIRTAVLQQHPDIKGLLEAIMAKLSQEQLTALNKQVAVDKADPKDVARAWLQQQGFVPTGGSGKGTITVGSTNFYEQEILGELFAQQLEANGYTVVRRFRLGSREVVEPAIEHGQIDVEAEYMATLLEFLDKGAGLASGDPAKTATTLATYLSQRGLSLLQYAQATDQNGFAVTKQTAQQYGLVNISDLARPAP